MMKWTEGVECIWEEITWGDLAIDGKIHIKMDCEEIGAFVWNGLNWRIIGFIGEQDYYLTGTNVSIKWNKE
jgi:hypothetical protein